MEDGKKKEGKGEDGEGEGMFAGRKREIRAVKSKFQIYKKIMWWSVGVNR